MRVLLVDEQRLFREGLRALLREGGHVDVVGQAASARECYALLARLQPDVVMMELLLPGVDGVTAGREVRRLRPACKIVVLTGCKDRGLLQAAWQSGIDACLTKDESVETLMAALASLEAGRRYVGASMRKTSSHLRRVTEPLPRAGDPLAPLSAREKVVFALIVRGFSTKAVAHELCISTKTVETHRAHINEKLAVHSTADLVRYAFRKKVPVVALANGTRRERLRSKPHPEPAV